MQKTTFFQFAYECFGPIALVGLKCSSFLERYSLHKLNQLQPYFFYVLVFFFLFTTFSPHKTRIALDIFLLFIYNLTFFLSFLLFLLFTPYFKPLAFRTMSQNVFLFFWNSFFTYTCLALALFFCYLYPNFRFSFLFSPYILFYFMTSYFICLVFRTMS